MKYSKILKPKLVGAPYKRKECNSFYYALILIGFITQRVNGYATNDVMTQQEVKCTLNNQWKCTMSNEKQDMLLCEVQNFSFQCICNHFLYENMTNIYQANLMQVPCTMHNNAKNQNAFVFLN